MEKQFGCIYLLENVQNKYKYIGQTVNFNARMKQHFNNKNPKTYIDYSIKKYGQYNFKIKILGFCDSRKELNIAEKECIEFYQSNNRLYGYNITSGGEGISGYLHTEKTREKISKKALGRKMSEETKQKIRLAISGEKNPMFGNTHSEETKQKIKEANERTKETRSKKISESMKGNIPWNKGKKYSTGYKHTEEELQKMRVALKGKNLGKKLSNETKQKISIATSGEKNPMFGISPEQRMINKYGEEVGKQKYLEWRQNVIAARKKLSQLKVELK